MPLDVARKYNAKLLETEAGRRLQALTYEGKGYKKGDCLALP